MSKLYFRYGAMNSGKSTHLMQVAYNYEERGMKVLIIKPMVDKKGGDTLVSRLGVGRKVDLLLDENDNVLDIMKTICACGKKAIFNGRKINNKFVFEGEQIAIDEQNDVNYESLCGECYYKYKLQ